MKKIFYFTMCLAALAFISCDKENTKTDNGNEEETPAGPVATRVLDDFENGGKLSWNPADGVASFDIVDNPSKDGINKSAKCGKIVTGGAQWEFLWSTGFGVVEEGDEFDFLNFSEEGYIIRIMVMAPKADSPVFLKLEGVDVPSIEIGTVKTTKANEWEVLEFDFEPYSPVDGAYKNFVILFDAGVTSEGGETYYYDNIEVYEE